MADTNGRQASEAPSSSSSDLYAAHTAESTDAQPPATNGTTPPLKPAQIQALPITEDDGDCSSEMDVSDASSSVVPVHTFSGPAHAGAKRKLSDAELVDASPASVVQDIVKKPRISLPIAKPGPSLLMTAGWPPEIWQQVFTHLSPAMLSRCLRVCRSFKFCLTQLKAPTVPRKKNTPLARVLESEALWTQARKHAYPTMPRPLVGFSELQMLQLVGGTSCQSCGKPHVKSSVTNVFNAGPGESGVRVIWPFRVRLCGNCFVNESLTDIQMLSTKHPAAPLTRGLPYAFRTPDGHFVPDHIRQSPNGMPAQTRLQKTFYKKDVDNITAEVDEVNSFGDGAADEWRKGMTQRGKDAMADSSRWERWEGTMSLGKMPAEVLREYDLASFPRLLDQQQRQQRQATSQYAHVGGALAPPPFHGTHPLPQPVHVFANTQPQSQHHILPPGHSTPPVHRPVRNAHEVEAARQARRADIERRCLELDPPLQANALQHIKAFRDTMQITTPMTDAQWENMLKPKIMEEREAAELQEHQRAQQLAALQAAIPSTVSDETFTRPAKEVYDRDYENSQEPLRQKLGEYATDHINGHWLQGRALDRDSAPLFAVDVLLHVRQRYIVDREAGILDPVIEGAPKFHLAKQSTPPLEPFLSLDNMKWVFDNKVRTYTDPHRRELFICAGCAEDRKPKWFAFEGLIQHYGAKHTSAFSKGNVVVHWQTAEWPEEPPFFENPAAFVKAERKFSGAKTHGRSRGTPQGSLDETVRSPAPIAMLSDNPVFSAGKTPALGQNGHHPVEYPQGGYGYQYQPPAQPKPEYSKESQVAKVSADAREIWDQLDGVKELQEALECVRMFTVLHHMSGRFMQHFHHAPLLDTLTDALATNELMKPIKSTHALACKICTAEQVNGTADKIPYNARIRKMKMYNISALVTHFKITHQPAGVLNWDLNLIELPDNALVGELIRKPGMDDNKLKLIAAAFPAAFPSPLPHIGTVLEAPPDPGPDTGLASRLVKKLTKGQPQSKKKRKGQAFAHDRNGSVDPSTDSREEEYDPRRPMFVDKKPAEFDPSRFDTDLARKDEPSNGNAHGTFNLAPETLAALNALQVHSTATPAVPETRYSSPSIKRSDSRPASAQETAPPSLPQVTPDIAAILATLTGQTQGAAASATPSATSNQGPSRTPGQPPYEQYAPPVQQTSPAYANPEGRRPQNRYVSGGSYPSSVEPAPARYDGQDLQAALSRNAQNYAHNGHASYAEPAPPPIHASTAPAPAPAPVYAAHPVRSPPRYRVVYEDEPAYPQPRPHHHHQPPYDGQPAPIQYVPIPEPSLPYRYEQYPPPPPKPIYVDQYGRPVELIPIDAAPAPVQYMPHPYDIQQQQQQQQQYARPGAYAGAPQYSAPPAQQPAVYYEQAPPHAHQGRYVYEDDGRGSVPRA